MLFMNNINTIGGSGSPFSKPKTTFKKQTNLYVLWHKLKHVEI